jgi:hypothetical protein
MFEGFPPCLNDAALGEIFVDLNYYRVTSVDQSLVPLKDKVEGKDSDGDDDPAESFTVDVSKSMVKLVNVKTGKKTCVSGTLVPSMVSSDQWDTSTCLPRTEIVQVLIGVGVLPFKITFRKQVTSNDVADALEHELEEHKDFKNNKTKRRKIIKQLMEGETRVMRARLVRSQDFDVAMELGRIRVIDLDKSTPQKEEERLVDTRTIEELVINGRRFTPKP